VNVDLKALIGKLNPATRDALEDAARLCAGNTHYDVEVEHFLLKLLDQADNDVVRALAHFEINRDGLGTSLVRAVDRFKRGNARTPVLGARVYNLLREAWSVGSVDYGAQRVRSGFVLIALCADTDLARAIRDSAPALLDIPVDKLRKEFLFIVGGSPESHGADTEPQSAPTGETPALGGGKTPNLDKYTVDLTQRAKQGKIDPVLGRDAEIRQIIDILMRRRQNNPILTGEAGVGKTAVVEGFAARVAQGDVPQPLRTISVRGLDLALLQAGAGIKGEFENRLKGLIEEVKSSPSPIVLFIDEAHTMIGAGGQAGQNDAANLLKPALARGELRTIAATTWSEYKKYFEKDAALARRFQVVKVEEPDESLCAVMLRGVVSHLEKHHAVRILDEAVSAAVRLSSRYLAGRQLPDKAVSVLDTACARVALGENTTPPPIEDAVRQLDDLEAQERVLQRETAIGADHSERLEEIHARQTALRAELEGLRAQWEKAKTLVARILDLRAQLEEGKLPEEELGKTRDEHGKFLAELAELEGERPLIRVSVDSQSVSEVISAWTGIPVGKMLRDDLSMVLDLERLLAQRVIGQDHALASIAQRISTARARLDDPNKPIGVFLLVGPSGVGKTETALALADLLYGGERNLITINMSEFQEAHTVSLLKGSPPGYVGYGEGGVLTEAVRRRPYSVVLLDEVEKAHPDVLELFYQVFDKGMMEDAEGREIDCRNTVIILTTNAATDTLMRLCADPSGYPAPEEATAAIRDELNDLFKPAFLGRVVLVPYLPIRDEILRQIIELKLSRVVSRFADAHRARLEYGDDVVGEIARRCTEVESGARNVDNILTNTLLPDLSREVLGRMVEGRRMSSVLVGIDARGQFTYQISSV
jgi:type VI secretion system protein VasG